MGENVTQDIGKPPSVGSYVESFDHLQVDTRIKQSNLSIVLHLEGTSE